MKELNHIELKHKLLSETNFNIDLARKGYEFIMADNDLPAGVEERDLPDGVYFVKNDNNTIVPFSGQKHFDDCCGIGVKYGDASFVAALRDACDDEVPLTVDKSSHRSYQNDFHKAVEDYDGAGNTKKLLPVLNPDIQLGKDEYIPSLGELLTIFMHFDTINRALTAVGGDTIRDDWYWSSTEYSAATAWVVYLNIGNVAGGTKATSSSRVRPVSAFIV